MSNIEATESNIEATESNIETSTETVAEAKQPAWEAFTAACTAQAQLLGLEVKTQVGYVQYRNAQTAHKLYVSKGSRSVKRIDTTLPLLGVWSQAQDIEKPNGRIACHVPADLGAMFEVLGMLASEQFGSLPAPKRTKKAAGEATSTETEAPAAE